MSLVDGIFEAIGVFSFSSCLIGATGFFIWKKKKEIKIPHSLIQKAIDIKLPIEQKVSGISISVNSIKLNFNEDGRIYVNVNLSTLIPVINKNITFNFKGSGIPYYQDGKIFLKDIHITEKKEISENVDLIDKKDVGWFSSITNAFKEGTVQEKTLGLANDAVAEFLNHFPLHSFSEKGIEGIIRKNLYYIRVEPDGILMKLK